MIRSVARQPTSLVGVALVMVALLAGACTGTPSEPGATGAAAITRHGGSTGLNGTLVDPPLERPTPALRDVRGEVFSVAERPEDELTVLFFGYTHCPDVCPTTMADLARARALLPETQRGRLTVAFVTEDPRRDTPAALRRWLRAFDPTFVGLIGGNTATSTMLKELYSPATRRLAKPEKPIKHPATGHEHQHHGSYGIEHTAMVYAFAPGGISVIYSGDASAAEYAADFRRLLEQTT